MTGLAVASIGLMLLAGAGGVGFVFWRREKRLAEALNARLHALNTGMAKTERAEADWLAPWLAKAPRPLRTLLGRADVEPRGRLVVIFLLVLLTAAFLFGRIFGSLWGLAVLAGGLAAPLVALQGLAAWRLKAFIEALPYFLDAVRQLLSVGNSIQQALIKACEAASPALQRYLQPTMRRIANGAAIPDAVAVAAERIRTPELYMLATAVRTNIRFGGALSPILGDFAEMLRDRARVGREIAAATAETRLSATILSSLPFAAIGLLLAVNPGYIAVLWTTSIGHKMIIAAVALQITGMLAMRRLMRIDF